MAPGGAVAGRPLRAERGLTVWSAALPHGTIVGVTIVEESIVAALPAGDLPYTLRRSPRARHVRVVIDRRRGAIVTVPGGRRLSAVAGRRLAADFVRDRERWIRRHLKARDQRQEILAARGPFGNGAFISFAGRDHLVTLVAAPAGARRASVLHDAGSDQLIVRPAVTDPRQLELVVRDWLRAQARERIEAAIALHAPALGVRPTRVTIRDTRSRWGSASKAGRLSFSWRLVLAPPEALETVVIHELAHLRVFGHGPRFWSLVAGRRPDHLTWRRWLRDHADELHATLELSDGAAA